MTAPAPSMCVVCASLPANQRSANTDGVGVRTGKLLCQTHLDGHDQVVQTGGVFRR